MGKIHSIESTGLLDGPGIRFVAFFQGCKLRCKYCHNPDTWDLNKGKEMTSEDLFNKAKRFKTYFKTSGGGITCSGGEPLLQPKFLKRFLKMCKSNGIHTAIDTAGFGKGDYEEILKYTDLVLLDLKHVDKPGYKDLTGGDIKELFKFKKALNKSKTKVWIRHVVIPGLTDGEKHIDKLKEVIDGFNNVEKVELLPYHTLGINKYKEMGISYKLKNVKPMDERKLKILQSKIV
ncbi:MAG: pyruvate formate lyase-activating protein [Firmicutes bacterium]|nr:pyruvate formate lyase-activating protein [Bacillota bacterium]